MNRTKDVHPVRQWLSLPEVEIPSLQSSAETGLICDVLKVGILAVAPSDCAREGLDVETDYGGKCVLPTTTVNLAGQQQLSRLPSELSSWAFDCVALATTGRTPFPAKVEFGVLDGRVYAEFV